MRRSPGKVTVTWEQQRTFSWRHRGHWHFHKMQKSAAPLRGNPHPTPFVCDLVCTTGPLSFHVSPWCVRRQKCPRLSWEAQLLFPTLSLISVHVPCSWWKLIQNEQHFLSRVPAHRMRSWSPTVVWVEKGFKDDPVSTPCHGQGCYSLSGVSGPIQYFQWKKWLKNWSVCQLTRRPPWHRCFFLAFLCKLSIRLLGILFQKTKCRLCE